MTERDTELTLHLLFKYACENRELLSALIESNLALIATLQETVPGFRPAYAAHSDIVAHGKAAERYRDDLKTMQSELEKVRAILGIDPDGKPQP